jgi:transcriptional regulator with GAF, ATPase, and Fis domain
MGIKFMFTKLSGQIKTLDEKRRNLDADWEASGNHSLLEFYVKIMPNLIDAERCSIVIHDPMHESVWLKAETDEDETEFSINDNSIIGSVIATGKPTIIHGINESERNRQDTGQDSKFMTESVLCLPVKSLDGKSINGAVQLLNKKAGEKFTDEDIKSLEEVAHYLEWSLENIHYHAEAAKILENVYSVLTRITFALIAMVIIASPFLMLWGFPHIVRIFFNGN